MISNAENARTHYGRQSLPCTYSVILNDQKFGCVSAFFQAEFIDPIIICLMCVLCVLFAMYQSGGFIWNVDSVLGCSIRSGKTTTPVFTYQITHFVSKARTSRARSNDNIWLGSHLPNYENYESGKNRKPDLTKICGPPFNMYLNGIDRKHYRHIT